MDDEPSIWDTFVLALVAVWIVAGAALLSGSSQANMPGTFQPVLAPAPTLVFTANVTQTGGAGGIAAGRTYNTVAIGAASGDRNLIIFNGFRDAGNCPLASMVINGTISATRQAQNINTSVNTTITSIWTAPVPTGTTANIVTTYCGNVDSAEGLGVYAAYGLRSTTPVATAGSSSSTAPSLNLNVTDGGLVVAGAWALGQSGSMCTWSGVTADYAMITDPTSTSQIQSGASASGLANGAPRSVSCTYGTSSSGEASASAISLR